MAVETASYIEQLNLNYPDGASEYVYEGDDHLRLIKKAVKQTFTGFAGAVAIYGNDTSNTNAYIINPTTALPGYTVGSILVLKITNVNTSAASVTVNISSRGNVNCVLPDGSAIPAGALSTTNANIFIYNGTNFVLIYPTSYFTSTAYFSVEFDNGDSGSADTVNWKLGNKQKSRLTGNCTYTFTAPSGPCNLMLKVTQDGSGSRTPTWPATVKWSEGVIPTGSSAANAVDIYSFYFDGTNYYGSLLRNCS